VFRWTFCAPSSLPRHGGRSACQYTGTPRVPVYWHVQCTGNQRCEQEAVGTLTWSGCPVWCPRAAPRRSGLSGWRSLAITRRLVSQTKKSEIRARRLYAGSSRTGVLQRKPREHARVVGLPRTLHGPPLAIDVHLNNDGDNFSRGCLGVDERSARPTSRKLPSLRRQPSKSSRTRNSSCMHPPALNNRANGRGAC
jgi:hypothetical protein